MDDRIAVGSGDLNQTDLAVYSLASGVLLKKVAFTISPNVLATLASGFLVGGDNKGTLVVFDLNLSVGLLTKKQEAHADEVIALLELPNRLIASASDDKTVKIWRLPSQRQNIKGNNFI